MSPVLEAVHPKISSTVSSYYNEWLSFLDEDVPIAHAKQAKLPDLSMCIVERPDGNWVLVNGETSGSGKIIEYSYLDVADEIESGVMPPKKRFKISLNVKGIRKGRPSVCDEVEYE